MVTGVHVCMLTILPLNKAEVLSFTQLNPKTWKALSEFEIILCKINASFHSSVKPNKIDASKTNPATRMTLQKKESFLSNSVTESRTYP